MISKYRHFPRTVDILGERAKIIFFNVILKYRNFPRNVDSLGDTAKKKQFFGQKSIFFIYYPFFLNFVNIVLKKGTKYYF